MSADTHKYGYSVKGTSVVLFRSLQLRRHAVRFSFFLFEKKKRGESGKRKKKLWISLVYFFATDWSGGIYATSTLAGSRPGGLIAATWAALMCVGQDGYRDTANKVMAAVKKMRKGIEETKGIKLMGDPKMSILAFESADSNINIFHVSGAMSVRGWALNNCQYPDCAHICVTRNNMHKADKFVQDITESVAEVRNDPSKYKMSQRNFNKNFKKIIDIFIGALVEGVSSIFFFYMTIIFEKNILAKKK
ncbi:hypothetical protein RFI_01068 [Reticulomyxa filosa]|uniref:Sphingosine-1-phosphate lyase n=1 Tax=Reticulomyxa filosa TaxID=46433 RepID=X6PD12_RETFI|nr:hypothetical protein RFI_01068 [Reticulomyxa filosa]|eukprot:ETO35993.1 hypothetical protein RFI_01068 [Reticulomyxa filosa]